MTRWVCLAALVLVCVGCAARVDAEPRSWSRSHSRRDHRMNRHRSRASSTRWRTGSSRRPSVPETVHHAREDSAAQMQWLWNMWNQNGSIQSDQPQPKPSFVSLKQQLASSAGVNRLRKLGPERAFDHVDVMNDAGLGFGIEGHRQMIVLMVEIQMNHSCREPARQLVRVSNVYPSTSAVYVPPSVLLRRCSDQVGCCTSDSQSCVSVANVTTKLPVLVDHIVGSKERAIKYLKFVEDTECRCTETRWTPSECQYNLPINDASDVVGSGMGNKHSRRKKPAQQTCRCTSELASRTMPDGTCKCDCFDSNRKCKRQRRGKAHLSEIDNRCIMRGNCEPPDCKYGKYQERRSRCPRQKRQRFVV